MGDFNVYTDGSPEWMTPPYITEAVGPFDLDPCCPPDLKWRTADHIYSERGLEQEWFGRVWLNPPYGGETAKWIKKLSEYRSGIGLIFLRSDARWVHRYVLEKCVSLFMFEGRLKFYFKDGTQAKHSAPAPSVLVSYSGEDCAAIARAKAAGKLKGYHMINDTWEY